jgi:hypothetical protein
MSFHFKFLSNFYVKFICSLVCLVNKNNILYDICNNEMCCACLCFRSLLENHVSTIVQTGTGLGNLKYKIYCLTKCLSMHKKLALVNRILYLYVWCTNFGMIFYVHICACRYNRKDRFVTQNPGDRIWATLFFFASYMNSEWEPKSTHSFFLYGNPGGMMALFQGLKIV